MHRSSAFHATKAFNTMEGGCLCSHDKDLIDRAERSGTSGSAPARLRDRGSQLQMMEICGSSDRAVDSFDTAAGNPAPLCQMHRRGLADVKGASVGSSTCWQEPIWLYLPVVITRRSRCDP